MRRNQKGSAIVEGACAIMLIIPIGVMATLLILNSGAGILFKQKIQLVSAQAAQFAAAHEADPNVESDTKTFVQTLMPTLGLTPSSLTVTVTQTSITGMSGMQVTVTSQFPLFGKGLFPAQLLIADTEFCGGTISLPPQ